MRTLPSQQLGVDGNVCLLDVSGVVSLEVSVVSCVVIWCVAWCVG